MTAADAETELVAMRPFIALDPKGQWGVYASDVAPLHVDLSTAVESAGGKSELAKCNLEALESARRIAFEVYEQAPGKARQDFVTSEIDKITRIKEAYAELERAVWDSPNGSPTQLKLKRASSDFFKKHRDDIEYDGMDQLEFSLASAGDMNTVIKTLQNDATRPRFSTALVQAHLVAFSNLARGLMVYHVGLLVHRDIKAANIVLASGTPDAPGEYKFIDFGMSLPLSKAKTSESQAKPYVFWPLYTVSVFSKIAYEQDLNEKMPVLALARMNNGIFEVYKTQTYGTSWRPSWIFTESVHTKATVNLDKLAVRSSLGAVAAIHADIFGLYVMTLSQLYGALTGVRFTVDETLTTLKLEENGFEFASTALGKRVSMALGQLMLDVSVGGVATAGDAAGRFQSVLDIFTERPPATQLVEMLDNSRMQQAQEQGQERKGYKGQKQKYFQNPFRT
jgi:hypothetical protein